MSLGQVGAPKSQIAAGLYCFMRLREAVRSAPQVRKPIPRGRTSLSARLVGKGLVWRMEMASRRFDSSSETSQPAARKPRPPARETERARGAVAMGTMGAEIMTGDWSQGKDVRREVEDVMVSVVLSQDAILSEG